MGDILRFTGSTSLDLDPERITSGLDPEEFDEILVLGWSKDDDLIVSASTGKKAKLLYLIEQFRHDLMAGTFDVEE